MSVKEEPTQLYYDVEKNLIFDEGGYTVYNIFGIITPQALLLFQQKKEDMFFYGVEGQLVELYYPDYDDDEGVYYPGYFEAVEMLSI